MKKLVKLFSIAIVLLSFGAASFAQVTESTATATATILTPIAIEKVTDMNFGNLAVNATPGTVELTAAAVPDVTPSGGVTLMNGVTPTAASYTVTGLEDATYSIILPANGTVLLDGPGTDMAANSFVSSPTVAAGGVLTLSTQTLYVGATLSVAGSQLEGVYVSTPFDVIVNYN